MKTYRKHLHEKLKNDQFRRLYEEERQISELSLKIFETRETRADPRRNCPKVRKK